MVYWKSTLEKMEIDNKFWKDKKVLVTGHTGFKGSWLSLWLQKLNANVCGFSKSIPTNPSMFEIANVGKDMQSITGDVRDFDNVNSTIEEFQPEIIIHMAAQSIVLKSYDDPLETYTTNVIGTLNLFEAVRRNNKTRVIINVTSDKCYEDSGLGIPFKESDPIGGYDPYSSSKGCSEIMTSSFRNSFFNPQRYSEHKVALASTRAGNVIGGGDWAEFRLIPDMIKGIQGGKIVNIRNQNYIRPWQFVLEPLNGYLMLSEKLWKEGPSYSQAWNFGPLQNEKKTVSYLISRFTEEFSELKIKHEENKAHESESLTLDSTKARDELGWRNKLDLEKTVSCTVEWYKKFLEGKNMKEFSYQQIENFTSL
jgi:CDP-glucose 4,6-dehydratase